MVTVISDVGSTRVLRERGYGVNEDPVVRRRDVTRGATCVVGFEARADASCFRHGTDR